MQFGVTITTTGVPGLRRRDLRLIQKGTWFDMGDYTHKEVLREKFKPSAARRYKYSQRFTKEVTTGRVKFRKVSRRPRAPSGNPLEWSGRSKSLGRQRRIRATANGVTISSPIRAFNFKPPRNPKINMRAEYNRLVRGDIRGIERRGSKTLTSLLQNSRVRKTVRIGVI